MENLDCLTTDDLHKFAAETRGLQPRAAAKHLFGTSANGRTRAVKDLNNYAWNLITARLCRERGDISAAIMYEDICDRIYSNLPEFAKW